jgi:hypothetical protein
MLNIILCAEHYSLCWTYNCVLNIIRCTEHYTLCWTFYFVLNITVCAERTIVFWTLYPMLNIILILFAEHCSLCWKSQFVPTDEIRPEFCSFHLYFCDFQCWDRSSSEGGTAVRGRSPYYSGTGRSFLLQTQGRAKADGWQLIFCYKLSYVVFIWIVCYEWLRRVLDSDTP